jgi:hypothetical protein
MVDDGYATMHGVQEDLRGSDGGAAWLGWVNNSLDLRSAFRQGTFTPEFFPFSG